MVAELRVLGPFQVVGAGGEEVRCGGPKQQAVLATLALRANHVVPTASIVQVVWGESAPRSAVRMVRTYVSQLRKVLPAVGDARLTSRRPGYLLEIDLERVDAHRFVALVQRGREAADGGRLRAASKAFDEALGFWRGDMLADLGQTGALQSEVSRLEELRLAALEDRIDVELAAGRHVEAAAELETLTAAHPFRERLWGQRMVALYRCGRQADALAAYQSVRSTLVGQLGVEPGPELQALEHQVLVQAPGLLWRATEGRAGPSGASAADVAGSDGSADPAGEHHLNGEQLALPRQLAQPSARRSFVGRAPECARLAECLDKARSGRFVTAFLAGPPGIGKTALAGWFARRAHAEGATVLLGRVDEGAGVPFLPIGEAIGHWAAHVPHSELNRLSEVDRWQLARLAPEIAERRSVLRSPPAPEAVSADDRQELFRTISRWVGVLAIRAPAVLVLEDLHLADPATLLAVRHLLCHPPNAGALVVATYRDTEAQGLGELTALLRSLREEIDSQHISLAGLDDADAIDLLASQVGRELDPEGRSFAVQLNRVTGGNPLFICEMVQHLTERQAIVPAGRGWTDQPAPAPFGVPPAVIDVIEQRLERLPASTTVVLRQAAVLGEHFDLPLLSRTTGMAEISVVEALEPAVGGGLVSYDSPRADGCAFSHSLVREAILAGLPLSQRVRIHWKAGLAIQAVSASRAEPPLGEIARHLAAGVRAGDPRTAVMANVRAGRQATATLAFEDARARFATATELAETTGLTDPELVYDAWAGRGWASSLLADLDGQRTSFLAAATIAREQRWAQRLATAALGLVAATLGGSSDPGEQFTATTLMDDALAMLGDEPTATRCLLLSMKAVLAAARQRADAQSLARLAVELGRSSDDPTARTAGLTAQAWALLGTPRPDQLYEAVEQAFLLEVPVNMIWLRANLVVPLVPVAPMQQGDRDRLESLRGRLAAPWVQDIPHISTFARAWDTAVALCEGRFSDAEQIIATMADMEDWWFWKVICLTQSNLVARERGHSVPSREALAHYVSLEPDDPGVSSMRALLAGLHAQAGDHAAAVHQAGLVRRQLSQFGWSKPFVLCHLAEAAAVTGDPGLAADLVPVLTDYSGQMLLWFMGMTIEAAADRALGQALLPLGRFDEAVARFEAAKALEQGFGAHALVARTTYWHARARLERNAHGDQGLAIELLDGASSQARELGMGQLERDVETLAREALR